ncbi:MAG: hypothetical protein RIQ62_39 [Bacteroidota bacterium]|jgi:gliding motility-associated-like protein
MRRLFYLLALTLPVLFFHERSAAQCATLQIIGPPGGTIPCDSALNLVAQVNFPTGLNNTTAYTHDTIPFAPQPWVSPNPILVNIDDIWSQVVSLPFPFCFFGNTYTDFIISSNGQIGFDLSQAGLWNAWATTTFGPAPVNNVAFNNTIMSPHHDMLPTNAGAQITWGVTGVAPCRTMVVNWTNISMFSCTTQIDTQQIVLHELTNLIDINIKNKPLCAGWNGGLAYEGIQNSTGTVAYMTPGRNGTQWTAQNSGYRFTPSGPATPIAYSFTWTNAQTGAILGTGSTLTLPPPVQIDSVSCTVNVTGGCAPYSFSSTFQVGVGKVNANFTYDKYYGCDEDTVVFNNTTNPQIATSYIWDFGDLNTSTDPNPTHIYANQGTYVVTLIADHPPCLKDTITQTIVISHPINAAFSAVGQVTGKDSICLGETLNITSASTPITILSHAWDFGDATTPGTGATLTHLYGNPGTYTITLIITDTLGCHDTTDRAVFVDNPPFEAFTMTDSFICVGDAVFFTDTLAPFVQSFTWDFGDGKRLDNVHNPSHTWDTPGTKTVTLIGNYLVCPSDSVSQTVSVDAYPVVNLGPDSSICPGLTSSILLANLNNTGSLSNLWSTGATSNAISVNAPGYYWLQETSPNGECKTTDSIWIKRDCYINIPNSFSPNGDGVNDYFIPRELLSSGIQTFSMSIYNRWGELIFKTTATDGRGWDGKYNGVDQNVGVYVYLIDVKFDNNISKNFTGNVTLFR